MRFTNSFPISPGSSVRFWAVASVIGLLAAMPFTASAQSKKPAPARKAVAPTWSKYDCGQGVELRVSAPAASQGSLLIAEVRSAKPLTEVAGKWTEKDVPFWRAAGAGPG